MVTALNKQMSATAFVPGLLIEAAILLIVHNLFQKHIISLS
jgi:hypothetical protein